MEYKLIHSNTAEYNKQVKVVRSIPASHRMQDPLSLVK